MTASVNEAQQGLAQRSAEIVIAMRADANEELVSQLLDDAAQIAGKAYHELTLLEARLDELLTSL